ncbi:uncharacterized protein [Paramormyrops kingsleyae]|uniref:Uncharacterized LOC111847622 n=1 Tax=Paramormyrops kingsleyae TaxID=1676925 RepID=A0A3B3R2A2_9TELE|nr:uncharacterized protein LOC111847622 [Paramormyrops kingsleyae]
MSASHSGGSADWLTGADGDGLFGPDREQVSSRRMTRSPTSAQEPHCEPHEAQQGGRRAVDYNNASCGCPSSSTWISDGDGHALPGCQRNSGSLCPPVPRDVLPENARLTRKRLSDSVRPGQSELPTDGNKLFAHKCSELQCYIPPLSSILNGLRSGRYRQRLTSFQESVAMDRIQRIMGVLQNRCMGEKYVSIILKVEEMLKNWFPKVKPGEQGDMGQEEMALPKKQKLCVGSPARSVPPAHRGPIGASPSHIETSLLGPCFSTRTKWLHMSPICSPAVESPPGRLPSADQDLTQDSAISSSTDIRTDTPPPGRPPPAKINAPCLERLLKSTDSIITCRATGGASESSWS